MSSVFQLLLEPSDFARLAADGAVVIRASALHITATSFTSAPSKGGGGLFEWIFVLLVHRVFPLDGADVTIALAAERAAASTRSMAS
jgi:hypothetical protein